MLSLLPFLLMRKLRDDDFILVDTAQHTQPVGDGTGTGTDVDRNGHKFHFEIQN
jgi:hypothetical protein